MRSRLEVLISVRDDGKDSGKSRRRRAREMTTHVGIEDHRQTYFELKEDGACHAQSPGGTVYLVYQIQRRYSRSVLIQQIQQK